MEPISVHHQDGVVQIVLRSPDRRGKLKFGLDFAAEWLLFDLHDLTYADDRSSAAAEIFTELKRFSRDYFGNGQLHIYNADTDALIPKKDAFIPVNMYLDYKAATVLSPTTCASAPALVFPRRCRPKRPISDMSLTEARRRLGRVG